MDSGTATEPGIIRSTLHLGDCLDVLPEMEADSVDAVICDPPYGLAFMGRAWDHGVPGEPYWREALRVAKPGAHLLAFGGTRTHHRLMVAIEDAGWEIRDVVMWVYGSGFPKSLDVSKAIDKAAGAERARIAGPKSGGMAALNKGNAALGYRDSAYYDDGNMMLSGEPATEAAAQWQGWGTALKPAWEPIIVARKPLIGTVAENVLAHGTGALNIDGCRIPANDGVPLFGNGRREAVSAYADGLGCDGRTGEVSTVGRWPANLVHDGSDEVVGLFPESKTSAYTGEPGTRPGGFGNVGAPKGGSAPCGPMRGDSGSAARFFYCAKASKADRDEGCEGIHGKPDAHNLSSNACGLCGLRVKANGSGKKCECGDLRETIKLPTRGNGHPTVKPTALMRYLCRLVTPPGGVVLDPFMGSGSTGKAAMLEGFRFIGIDKDPDYFAIAKRRISHAQTTQPDLFTQDQAHG